MKALRAENAKTFKDIPNIGPSIAADFKLLGLSGPVDLKRQDPLALYKKLCEKTGSRQDPCVLDTFMSAIDFMNGAPAKPWWHYTAERKRRFSL